MKTFEATLQLKPGAKPKFCKARPVPFALKAAIEQELDRLESEGILEKVSYSEWAATVVSVHKPEGNIRLCGDYKVTINPQLEVDQYPLPKPDNIFATLSGGKWFSKIDLKHAYQQIKLSESSRPLVTINTHRGVYISILDVVWGCLCPSSIPESDGHRSATSVKSDLLLRRYFDNRKLPTRTFLQCPTSPTALGRTCKSKCAFMCQAVEYLGHRVDAERLHTLDTKVAAIQKAPSPRDVQELLSFSGLVHYYGKFLSTCLQPLNNLLKSDTKWKWSDECKKSLQKSRSCWHQHLFWPIITQTYQYVWLETHLLMASVL